MQRFQRLLQGCVLIVFTCIGGIAVANEWLVAVLSGNARADAWLIPMDGDDHKAVLHNIADSKTNPAFVGHSGNIAFKTSVMAESNAIYFTAELLAQMLPELKKLQNDGKLGDYPSFSFLYGIAGLDAVDGKAPGYSPVQGRGALHKYEDVVDELFRINDITLNTLVGVHDGSLLLRAVLQPGSESENVVIYDDTYGEGYRLNDGVVVSRDSIRTDKNIPAGGYFHLGYLGGEVLSGENRKASDDLNMRIREFWKNRGIDYSQDEVRLRYGSSNRNELGGVLASLVREPESASKEDVLMSSVAQTVDSLVTLSQNLKTATPEQPAVIKIIGFYSDAVEGLPILKERFAELSGGTLIPELIKGEQLNQALTNSAVQVFKDVMKVRYGAAGL
ncbi:hypothetical protein [Parendozoicomonas sp. Alg238-R29]|uniref:hypothetical protein n=1 Tax=Parendozoicomonas sp. Alg238-R29 TaxID=2993446 RepID=UPI00248E1F93|nr:hypothetical protein [Parendozoicomonas sp. Alg238-R29]